MARKGGDAARGQDRHRSKATGYDTWTTPRSFFNLLDAEFNFDLDPCASSNGRELCPNNFTKEDDGLAQDWFGNVFVNPPYSSIDEWMEKAAMEVKRGCTVVLLVPCRSDVGWFHRWITQVEIRFVRGRLKFGVGIGNAPFPSVVIILRPGGERAGTFSSMSRGLGVKDLDGIRPTDAEEDPAQTVLSVLTGDPPEAEGGGG